MSARPVAVLCPGPSLPEMWCEDLFDEFEAVIAVNTAAWRFRHHWLCAADTHVFTPILERREGFHQPMVGVQSSKHFCDRLAPRGLRTRIPPLYAGVGVDEAMTKRNEGRSRMAYTFPNALHFALTCWNGPVEVYGMDYRFDVPCIGNVSGDRSRLRFRQEALWLREIWQHERISVYGRVSSEILGFIAGSNLDPWKK